MCSRWPLVGDLDADTGKAGRNLPVPAPYTIETSAGNFQPVFPLERGLTCADAKPIAVALSDAIGADARTKGRVRAVAHSRHLKLADEDKARARAFGNCAACEDTCAMDWRID